jgi:hypothetical protein
MSVVVLYRGSRLSVLLPSRSHSHCISCRANCALYYCYHVFSSPLITPAAASAAAEALAGFAAGLDADPAGVLPLWTAKSHPCGDSSNNFKPWPGITCNAPTGYVTGISLRGKGLSGKLPEGLSVLNTLRSL